MSKPTATASFDVNAVAVKLPEFWADNARVWFAQMEAQFAIRGVNSPSSTIAWELSTVLTSPRWKI